MGKEHSFFDKEPQLEHIPTREEVHEVFKEVIKGEYKEVQACEDENGLYLLEVQTRGDKEGEMTEYAYRREGHYKESWSADGETKIEVVYYNRDGIPVSGTTVARYIDGKWKILR